MLEQKKVTVFSKSTKIGENGRIDIQANDVNNDVSVSFVNLDKLEYHFVTTRENFSVIIKNMKLFDDLFKTEKSI